MNLQTKKLVSAALFALVAISTPALSQQDTGWYAGFGIGQAMHDVQCAAGESCDDKDTAFKIFGGYQFNTYFGVEVGYTDLGKATITDAGGVTKFEVAGFEVVGVGTLPINQQFAVYGKLGFFRWDLDASAPGISIGETGTDLTYGIGVRYYFTKNLAVRAEWQRYNDIGNDATTGKSDSDFIGVGLVFKF